jgi:hypothetical protein
MSHKLFINKLINKFYTVPSEKKVVAQMIKILLSRMKQNSNYNAHIQELVTKPDYSTPHSQTHFFKIRFHVFLCPILSGCFIL